MTTNEQAFEVVRQAHADAAANLLKDRAAAGDNLDLVRRINRNHKLLTISLLDAASNILDANNAGVDAAYKAAVAANKEVTRRRKAAEHIAEIVTGVATAVSTVATLVDKLNG